MKPRNVHAAAINTARRTSSRNRARPGDARPALEALHAVEFAQREDEFGSRRVYTNFGWLSTGAWDQVQRHMSGPDIDHLRYRRKAD